MDWLIEKLLSLIPLIAHLSKVRREIADNALNAFNAALNETSLYLAYIRQGGNPDRKREEQLARLWAAAAVPARHPDIELADMCLYKSDNRTNSDRWDNRKIIQYGIGIESVKKKYTELLHTR